MSDPTAHQLLARRAPPSNITQRPQGAMCLSTAGHRSGAPGAANGAHLLRTQPPSAPGLPCSCTCVRCALCGEIRRLCRLKAVLVSSPPGGTSPLCAHARRALIRKPSGGFGTGTPGRYARLFFLLAGNTTKSPPGASLYSARARLLPLPSRCQPAADPESAACQAVPRLPPAHPPLRPFR